MTTHTPPCRRARWARLAAELTTSPASSPAAVARIRALLLAEFANLAGETADARDDTRHPVTGCIESVDNEELRQLMGGG